jgi:hypothetical protein
MGISLNRWRSTHPDPLDQPRPKQRKPGDDQQTEAEIPPSPRRSIDPLDTKTTDQNSDP